MYKNKNGSNWIRKDKRLAIYLRDNWRCVYCQKSLKRSKPKLRTLDHVVPTNEGGSNDETNLVTCCKSCNDRKQDKSISQFCAHNPKAIDRIFAQTDKHLDRKLAKQILAGQFDLDTIQEL